MRPTITEWISESVERRRRAKKELDSAITLSNGKQKNLTRLNTILMPSMDKTITVRMIDEGALVNDDGSVRIFIKKGTINDFINNLQDDYVGYVNLGHIDLESLPLLLGTWTKQDLHVIEKEDGRCALDCDLHLDDSLYIVHDLKRQQLPLSVSVEMYSHIDEESSELLDMPVVDAINIVGISIVGNPANVNSANIQLQNEGDEDMSLKDIFNSIQDTVVEKETLENETVEETKVEETLEQEVEESMEKLQEEQQEEKEELETITKEETSKLESYINELIKEKETLEEENKALKEKLEVLTKEKETLSARIEKSLGKMESLMAQKEEKAKQKLSNNQPEVDGWYYKG